MDEEALRPSVVQLFEEIVNMILVDDWGSFSSEKEEKYYIFGLDGFYRDKGVPLSDECSADKSAKLHFAPRMEKHARSLIAAPQLDYLMVATNRLKAVGIINEITEKEIVRFLQEYSDDDEWLNSHSPDQSEAIWHFYDALNTHRTNAADQIKRINDLGIWEVRDKYFLKEISEKYKKLLKRLSRLDPLEFSNPQLKEATYCWLYGFFRATIILSAIALEEAIKKATKINHFDSYEQLVNYAMRSENLTSDEANFAGIVFSNRTRVVHHNYQPSADDAVNTLAMVRGILAGLLKDKESTE
jgi:hypothetical protein